MSRAGGCARSSSAAIFSPASTAAATSSVSRARGSSSCQRFLTIPPLCSAGPGCASAGGPAPDLGTQCRNALRSPSAVAAVVAAVSAVVPTVLAPVVPAIDAVRDDDGTADGCRGPPHAAGCEWHVRLLPRRPPRWRPARLV